MYLAPIRASFLFFGLRGVQISRENGVLCTVARSWLLILHDKSEWKDFESNIAWGVDELHQTFRFEQFFNGKLCCKIHDLLGVPITFLWIGSLGANSRWMSDLTMDDLVCMFSMSGESDPVESFVFDQGRIQMPSLLFWTLDEPPFFWLIQFLLFWCFSFQNNFFVVSVRQQRQWLFFMSHKTGEFIVHNVTPWSYN